MSSASPVELWDDAPCGLLTLRTDGTVVQANGTFLDWVGRRRDDVLGRVRLSELLSVGGRIYWETHLSPLLHVEGRVDEIALELQAPGGRMPVLVTAAVLPAGQERVPVVRVALSSALERSRYERELLAARAAAERSEGRVQLLQQTTAALSRALGVTAVADAVLAAALGPVGASAATLWLADPDRGLVLHGPPADPASLPDSRLLLNEREPVEEGGRVVVPLHGQLSMQGLLSVTPSSDPGAERLDLEVLTAVGQQAGLALDRAQRYEYSAGVAHQLQHSLLALEPPCDDRFAVAVTYRPGIELLEVGGDWYDFFLADDGVLSIVVGDVVGRGLGAAIAMGQLRSAVRAVSGRDVGPARLLSRLDRFVGRVEAAGMATVVYGELDLERGRLRYACAGHPPPLLLPARGEPRFLWDGRSTPLGAFLHAQERGEAEVVLAPGDRLLLYTDGLVERREHAIDHRLDLLLETARLIRLLPLTEAVSSLTDLLLQDELVRDDVCVLLLSWDGTCFEHHLPADLASLSATRRTLHGWLTERGVQEPVAREVVLAASEAVANAAEHGADWRADQGVRLHVRLERSGGGIEVVVTVRDSGCWRPQVPDVERGRGLSIMKSLVDDVSVDSGNGTTVVLRRRLHREAS